MLGALLSLLVLCSSLAPFSCVHSLGCTVSPRAPSTTESLVAWWLLSSDNCTPHLDVAFRTLNVSSSLGKITKACPVSLSDFNLSLVATQKYFSQLLLILVPRKAV